MLRCKSSDTYKTQFSNVATPELIQINVATHRGMSRIFERGGSNISWFPKKRLSDFKRGGPMV